MLSSLKDCYHWEAWVRASSHGETSITWCSLEAETNELVDVDEKKLHILNQGHFYTLLIQTISTVTRWKIVAKKRVYAKHYDVIVKLTFDLLDIKCHHSIIVSSSTCICHILMTIKGVFYMHEAKKCVLWGYSDLGTSNCNHFDPLSQM